MNQRAKMRAGDLDDGGAAALILPGVTIGARSVSMLTRDITEGVPMLQVLQLSTP